MLLTTASNYKYQLLAFHKNQQLRIRVYFFIRKVINCTFTNQILSFTFDGKSKLPSYNVHRKEYEMLQYAFRKI